MREKEAERKLNRKKIKRYEKSVTYAIAIAVYDTLPLFLRHLIFAKY